MELSNQPEGPSALPPMPTEDKAEWPRTGLDSSEKTKIPCSYQYSNSEPSTYSDYAIPWQTVLSYISTALAFRNSVFAHTAYNATYMGALTAEASVRAQVSP